MQAYEKLLEVLAEAKSYCQDISGAERAAGFGVGQISRVIAGEAQPSTLDILSMGQALGAGKAQNWLCWRYLQGVDVVAMLGHLPHPSQPPRVLMRTHRAAKRIASQAVRQPHAAGLAGSFQSLESGPGATFEELRSLPPQAQARALGQHPRRRELPFLAATVRWLDLYRYDDPAAAAHLARVLAHRLCPPIPGSLEIFLRAMGTYGSAVRMRGSMTLAGMVQHEILPLAYRVGPRLVAELMQRSSYIIRDHGEHASSLRVSSAAESIYVALRDREGQAKAMIDGATALYLRGDKGEAEGEFKLALAMLPEGSPRYRSAAYQGLALLAGSRAEAVQYLDRAEALLRPVYARDRMSLAYSRAKLSLDPGEKEAFLRQAQALSFRFSPFESALFTLDLLALLVGQTRHDEARDEGRVIHRLMRPLRHHEDARAALLELAMFGQRITLGKIKKARQEVRKARGAGTPQAANLL